MNWICFITSLPTENATLRQRAWRALKATGAAVLRDGVYLLPDLGDAVGGLHAIAQDVRTGGGMALVLETQPPEGMDFAALFDRSAEFAALLTDIEATRRLLTPETARDATRQARKLRKSFAQLRAVDFFPGEPQRQLDAALRDLELSCAQALSPGEPHAVAGLICQQRVADFQGCVWATRARPWVDRLASAWLIRRFIDRQARFVWLAQPEDWPPGAVGFDFDGATFSHVGGSVTFEVLAASFALQQPAMVRLGLLVHCLDVGGIQPPEAAGLESILAGMREAVTDDDRLLDMASAVFDGLLASFERADPRNQETTP